MYRLVVYSANLPVTAIFLNLLLLLLLLHHFTCFHNKHHSIHIRKHLVGTNKKLLLAYSNTNLVVQSANLISSVHIERTILSMIVSIRSSSDQLSLAVSVVRVARLQSHIAVRRECVHTVELNVLLLSATVGGDTHRIGIVVSHVKGRVRDGLAIQRALERVQKSELEGVHGGNREPEVSFLLHVISLIDGTYSTSGLSRHDKVRSNAGQLVVRSALSHHEDQISVGRSIREEHSEAVLAQNTHFNLLIIDRGASVLHHDVASKLHLRSILRQEHVNRNHTITLKTIVITSQSLPRIEVVQREPVRAIREPAGGPFTESKRAIARHSGDLGTQISRHTILLRSVVRMTHSSNDELVLAHSSHAVELVNALLIRNSHLVLLHSRLGSLSSPSGSSGPKLVLLLENESNSGVIQGIHMRESGSLGLLQNEVLLSKHRGRYFLLSNHLRLDGDSDHLVVSDHHAARFRELDQVIDLNAASVTIQRKIILLLKGKNRIYAEVLIIFKSVQGEQKQLSSVGSNKYLSIQKDLCLQTTELFVLLKTEVAVNTEATSTLDISTDRQRDGHTRRNIRRALVHRELVRKQSLIQIALDLSFQG